MNFLNANCTAISSIVRTLLSKKDLLRCIPTLELSNVEKYQKLFCKCFSSYCDYQSSNNTAYIGMPKGPGVGLLNRCQSYWSLYAFLFQSQYRCIILVTAETMRTLKWLNYHHSQLSS